MLQIMASVGSLDSSRDLQLIHAKTFINRLHLVLHAYVQIFDVMFLGVKIWDLNTPKTVAINYICTPIKCNHCTLGEENQRYSSLVSYIDIKKLNSKICLQQFICILSVACGPWLARPTCQWLWMGTTAVLPVSFRSQTASSSHPFAFLPPSPNTSPHK